MRRPNAAGMLDRRALLKGALGGVAALAAVGGAASTATTEDPVIGPVGGDDWWPSKWGADDQAGASNTMSPARVLEAVALIEKGTVYPVGRAYEAGMPLFPGRGFTLRIPGAPTLGPLGKNKLVAHEEFLATEIGQVGSQFDGLAHIGVERGGPDNNGEKRFYNGVSLTDMRGSYGMRKLGVENVRPFFAPCVMFDVKALKGRALDRGEEVTVVDLEAALERQGLGGDVLREGGVALLRTGWGDQWMVDNKSYYDGEPGIGMDATQWLIDKGCSLICGDNWAVEVLPNPNPELAYPVHQLALTRHGVYLFENLDFDALAADSVYHAAFVYSPLPIKGATGSPGNPLVVA